MATYVYDLLPVFTAIQFNPDVDVIDFSGSGVSAAEVLPFGDDGDFLPLHNSARTVWLGIADPQRLGSANFTGFDDGSVVLIGDNAPTRFDDQFSQTLVGGAGNDLIIGAGGSDSMSGGAGNDLFFLVSGGDDDHFWGNQTIDGGAGFDYITTDSGNDRISFVGSLGGTINIVFTDTTFNGVTNVTTTTNVGSVQTTGVEGIEGRGGNDSLTGDASGNLLAGQDGNDTLNGAGGNDTLWGGEGNDSLIGGAGDDVLRGQAGADTAVGGTGNDTYTGLRPGDVVVEGAAEGTNDVVLTTTDLAVEDYGTGLNNIETIQLVGRAGMTQEEVLAKIFTGNQPEYLIFINMPELRGNGTISAPVANHLVGNDFTNDLNGRAGNDTLDGGAGFDIATFDEDDVVNGINVTLAESGPTTVLNDGFGTRDTLLNIEGVSGTKFNDVITGNDTLGNLLIGNWGDDSLSGRGGDDTMIGDNGADTFDGGVGSDWIAYFSTDDGVFVNLSNVAASGIFTPQYGSVTVAGGTAIDGDDTGAGAGTQYSIDQISNVENVVGWLHNDTLVGSDGNNILRGGGGDDVLLGRLGDDTLDGGVGTQDEARYNDGAHTAIFNGGSVTGFGTATAGTLTVNGNLATGQVVLSADFGSGATAFETDSISGIEVLVGNGGNDTLVGTDNAFVPTGSPRLDGAERFEGGAGNDSIDGGGATNGFFDIVSYRTNTTGVVVNLGSADLVLNSTTNPTFGNATVAGGTAQEISGEDTVTGNAVVVGTDTIANIDAAYGSDQADYLQGGSTSASGSGQLFEFFQGFAGADTIDGGDGTDRADYTAAPNAIVISKEGNVWNVLTDGYGSSDTLLNIEGIRASMHDDSLAGWSGSEFFEGLKGNDSIDGHDFAGTNTVQYRLSPAGVFVNLSGHDSLGSFSDTALDGWGTTDSLKFINAVVGSDFGDRFIGESGQDNTLDGGLGVRIDPTSTIGGGIGVFQDHVDYGPQSGGVVTHPNGIIVNLGSTDLVLSGNAAFGNATVTAGTAQEVSGQDSIGNAVVAGTDTLINIERITGTSQNDYIRGADLSGEYEGLFTDRTQRFAGGAGNDTIDGGSTSKGDFVNVDYSSSANGVIVNIDDQDHSTNEFIQFGTGNGGSGSGSINTPYGNNVSIAAGSAIDGTDGGSFSTSSQGLDSLSNIDGVIGSSHNDLIFGGSDSRNIWGAKVEIFSPLGGNDTVVGGQGFDFISYQGQTQAVSVNLQNGIAFDGTGGTDMLSGIDGIRGSQGNDTLTGSEDLDGNHRQIFEGNAGNDLMNGLDGIDLVSYRTSPTGVYVNVGDGFAYDGWMDQNGHEGIDRFAEMEGAQGSDFNDTLIGGALTHADEWEEFEGRAGNDLIDGNDSLDSNDAFGVTFPNEPTNHLDSAEYRSAPTAVIVNMGTTETIVGGHTVEGGTAWDGYGGTDTLVGIEIAAGSNFGDVLIGGNAAHDSMEGFIGLGGADTFVGGSGQDVVMYMDDLSAVVVNLGTADANDGNGGTISGGTALDGFNAIDSFTDIEQAIGSKFDDVIIGSDQANVLNGNDGDDTLRGGAGNDNLIGGDGNDIADYRDAGAGVTANLATGLVQDGDGGTDFLAGIEGVRGSSHDDTLIGNDGENTLHGAGGNDFLDGGGGNDWASYRSAASGVTVDLSTGTASDGLGGTDTLLNIENVRGGDFNDSLIGDASNNQLKGGLGNDTIDGGGGTDTARYDDLSGPVTIDLSAGTATDGTDTDTLISIESVVGTDFADSITGNSGGSGKEFLNGHGGNDTIIGGGSSVQTILNLSSYQDSSFFLNLGSLLPGTFGGYKGALTIGSDTITFDNIDGFIGTDFNDSVTGSSTVNDYFRGTGGQDTFDGGVGGFDTLSYRNSPDAVAVNLTGGNVNIATYTDTTGDTIGENIQLGAGQAIDGFVNNSDSFNTFNFDQVSNIEAVEGGDANDSIWGNGSNNRLDGGDGNDFLFDGGGNDTLVGGTGIDRAAFQTSGPVFVNLNTGQALKGVDGVNGIDTLSGIENIAGTTSNDQMLGTDTQAYDGLQRVGTFELFSGGLGNDTIDGGGATDGQFDIIDYGYQSTAGVNVSLASGTATGGGGTDSFTNIDMAIGSNFNDTLTGGSDSRAYQGSLFEAFRGGSGADTINGLGGEDRVQYDNANAPVYVNLGSTALTLSGTPYGNVTIAGGTAIDGTDTSTLSGGVQFSRDTLQNIENVRGSSFSDVLVGGGTQNAGTLYDYEVFEGLEGNDSINGQGGFDNVSYSRSDNAVDVDLSTGKAFDGFGTIDTLQNIEGVIGSDFADTIKGSTADGELFRGGAGNDTIDGDGGATDKANYNSSPGAVIVDLNAGTAQDGFGTVDTLLNIHGVRASIHADSLVGGAADEIFEGLQGNDTIVGGGGNDTADYARDFGRVVVDLAAGTAEQHEIEGGTGNDIIVGNDTLSGIHNVRGSGFADSIVGDANDNVIDGRGGADTIDGGAGNDTLVFSNATVGVAVDFVSHTTSDGDSFSNIEAVKGSDFADTFTIATGSEQIDGGGGNDLIVATATYSLDASATSVENLALGGVADIDGTGSNAANVITGNAGSNDLVGLDGNDTIFGATGNDTLEGGAGVDSLVGGAGNDTYIVNSPLDVINETIAGSSGTDTVLLSTDFSAVAAGEIQYTLGAGLENVTAQGSVALNVTGNTLANFLIGNLTNNKLDGGAGNDTLNGGVGADTMIGGSGNDLYRVDDVGDQVVEIGTTSGIDTVEAVVNNYKLPGLVENLTLVNSPVILVGRGNSLNNYLKGNDFDNQLFGDLGNDTLEGGLGNDRLYGGAGSDSYIINGGDTIIEVGGSAADKALAAVSINLSGSSGIENALAIGTGNVDITGNKQGNNIVGNSGDNILDGGAGLDTLDGGTGSDTYVFSGQIDKVTDTGGGDGVDEIQSDFTMSLAAFATIENLTLVGTGNIGGTGNLLANVITGNSGNNTLDGGAGSDTLIGGDGNDVYVVDSGGDRVRELGTGIDEVRSTQTVSLAAAGIVEDTSLANIENVTLLGTAPVNATGNDLANVLVGNGGANSLTGGLGDDTLDGGLGADVMVGGDGNDVYVINMATDVTTETGLADTADELRSATISLDLTPAARDGIENALLLGTGALGIIGDDQDNRLEGNAGNNSIAGGAGNDQLIGNAGNDTLNGGTGDDTMSGGVGNDVYFVDSSSDSVLENADEGTADTVNTTLSSYTLADNVENLVLAGIGDLSGTGNALANRIQGGTGNDSLVGGSGVDTLVGGAGNDTYFVDTQSDAVTDTAGVDTVVASVTYSIAANAAVENLSALAGTDNINLTGNGAANTLTGNDGNNVLDGGAGADSMHGGAGADTYIVDNGGDLIFDDLGTDTDTVQSKISLNLTLAVAEGGGNVENLVLLGTALNATGNALDNVLTGTAGNNILNGGAGADTMSGGAGADTYVVDQIGDIIVESLAPAGGVDTVMTDMAAYSLSDQLENLTFTAGAGLSVFGGGNEAANKITGRADVQDELHGAGGNDTLMGGNFADTLDGGTGIDSMVGGGGNDVYLVDTLTDKVIETSTGGTGDEIQASITYSIAALTTIENLTLTAGDINGTGNAGNNIITGSAGSNVLSGLAGNDSITGGAGNDMLIGGPGDDTLDGGADTDTVSYAGVAAAVTVNLGTSSATGDGNDSITGVENIIGGSAGDTLTGDANNNVIDGGLGNDTMTGGDGDDTYVVNVLGDQVVEAAGLGTGTDTVRSSISYTLGTNVENLVLTGTGNLTATGNALDNTLTGNAGNNTLDGGGGIDTVDYSGTTSPIFLDFGTNHVTGGAGTDTLINIENIMGGSGSDWVLLSGTDQSFDLSAAFSLASFENIRGTAGNDSITGDGAANVLEGGAGNDTLDGGAGIDDTAYYGNDTIGIDVDLTAGSTTGGSGSDVLANIENVVGSKANDTITGDGGDNLLDGGLGVDSLTGGLGNDTFVFDNVADQAIEALGEGTDKVISSVSISLGLGDNIENAELTGTATLNVVGNALDNELTGNAGANHIDGGAGNDTLDGGLGADTLTGSSGDDLYIVDNVGDKVIELLPGDGNDTVESSVTYTLGANVDNLTLTGTANINATGNADGNILVGNAGNNILDGKLGADTMTGGAGNDTYIVDNPGAQLSENVGEGTDLVKSSVTWTLGADFENLTLTGTAGINGTGNALDNLITGNAGANDLNGGAGNDTLIGLGGNDTYHVDSTGDVLIDSGGIDTVIVQDLDWTLATGFENLSLQSLAGHSLTGNTVANAITGGTGADTLIGLAGNDTLDGSGGADSLDGGVGNDTYHVDNLADVIVESPLATGGVDTVVTHFLNSYTLATGLENLTFFESEGAVTGTGNAVANKLTGVSLASNTLLGLGGNDTLIGGNAGDSLDGGTGTDSMAGGAGDDHYVIDVATDIVTELLNQGTDTVEAGISYTLKANFENLVLTGTANLTGTGNVDDNAITGNDGNNLLKGLDGADAISGGAGNDTLDGGTGADALTGGLGDDRFFFDNSGDTASENLGEGTDTIVSSVSLTGLSALAANVENAELTGTAALDLTGNTLDNKLTGNAGINHIDGGDGNDTLIGGAGSDTLTGGIGDDTFVFDAADTGAGAVQGGTGSDTLLVTGALPGGVLNLTTTPDNRYQGIDTIDITGPVGVNNKLVFDATDVRALADDPNAADVNLTINGDFFDTVDSQNEGWTLQGVTGVGDTFYVVYTLDDSLGTITLNVDQDTTQLIS